MGTKREQTADCIPLKEGQRREKEDNVYLYFISSADPHPGMTLATNTFLLSCLPQIHT